MLWGKRRDDTGSMPLALLVTLLGVTLSAGLSGMVIGQIKDTQRESNRSAAVAAAQAGLDAALAKIRAAVSVDAGDLGKLPCAALPGELTTAGAAKQGYSTSVGYFLIDPSSSIEALRPVGDLTNLNGLTATNLVTPLASQLNSTLTLANGTVTQITGALATVLNSAIGCVSGTLKQVPLFGLLRSVGTYGGVTRTLYATYKFRSLNETIPGGKILLTSASNPTGLCIGANSKTPAAGDLVYAVSCASDAIQVTFIYPKDLSLALPNTRSATYPYGLCITAPLVQAVNSPVSFQKCSALGDNINQKWDYDVNPQTYYGGKLDALGAQVRSGYCLNQMTATTTPGQLIVLKNTTTNCGKANTLSKSFAPEATVGAGGAGIESNQYVNKDEVGRCLDLTNEDASGAWAAKLSPVHKPALISYPCKQSLNGKPYWNHQWIGPLTPEMIKADVTSAKGVVYSIDNRTSANTKWCMKSPGINGGWVWVAACNENDANQQWTVYGATTLISQAYQVVDAYGHCLEAAEHRGADYVFGGKWSYIIATDCSGLPEQKWNAPTDPQLAPLRSIQER